MTDLGGASSTPGASTPAQSASASFGITRAVKPGRPGLSVSFHCHRAVSLLPLFERRTFAIAANIGLAEFQSSSNLAARCLHRFFVRSSAVAELLLRVLPTSGAMSRDASAAMKVRKPEPAEIEYKNMRFLITYRPTDATMDRFVEELKKHSVKDVVRVCDPTYNTSRLMQEGIAVTDLPFDDGTPPPDDVVTEWFNLLRERFTSDPNCCVAVHCIAGLGRAPVLVALALIELGMKYEDAVELIREKRRGSINAKQLAYLERYHPKSRLKSRGSNGHRPNCRLM